MDRRIRIVDVFGDRPLAGNQLAVMIDSEGISAEEMLEITRWIDFSETTFLSPPTSEEADYAVRIFTPAGELPFAGHPTLGSCHVWQTLADESRDEIVQECGAGLVPLRRSGDTISFAAPALLREGPVDPVEVAGIAALLGVGPSDILDASWVDNGPGWVGILLADADAVLALEPDYARHPEGASLDIGVVGLYPEDAEFRYEVRAFFAGARGEMREDPVTGSLNASVAQWLIGSGRVEAPYLASQGSRVGRSGRITISVDDDSVWVGGRVFDIIDGEFRI